MRIWSKGTNPKVENDTPKLWSIQQTKKNQYDFSMPFEYLVFARVFFSNKLTSMVDFDLTFLILKVNFYFSANWTIISKGFKTKLQGQMKPTSLFLLARTEL